MGNSTSHFPMWHERANWRANIRWWKNLIKWSGSKCELSMICVIGPSVKVLGCERVNKRTNMMKKHWLIEKPSFVNFN
jgi:hypothetical protein